MFTQFRWQGQSATISAKPNCLTVSVEKAANTDVFSYDYAGRLWTCYLDGISYRRGLDGKMTAKWETTKGNRGRRWVLQEEALKIEKQAREIILALHAALEKGEIDLPGGLTPLAWEGFRAAIAFDEARSRADAQRYRQVYKPVGILPPDQYFAVVLQATEGCAFNTCTFCDFYRDRPFRIKTVEEFRGHIQAVKEFLGAGMSLRRTIFLGDANALITPMPRLLELFDAVNQAFDVQALGGVYAFLDGFSGEKKTAADYRLLKERGLRRVYIGMESGDRALLNFLRKPGQPENVIQAVRTMKSGGVAVGLIILLGAGGERFARDHVRHTIEAINAMGLDLEDIIYFSELIESEGLRYVQDAYQAALTPLSGAERLAQGDAIERGLKFSRRGGAPHISRYDIREFVY